MTVIQTPDVIVKTIITELCTIDFDGIVANNFWNFVVSVCGEIDEFTRNVVWNWLLEKEEFQVWRKVDSDNVTNSSTNIRRNENTKYIQEKNDSLPDFQAFFNDINVTDYKIKVSDDYQSLYLTGVQQKDNVLGKMPYDLLRIIAKHKEKGINSLDLIEQSGQDKRSLTTRLQALENNLLIVKFSVSVKKCVTNHMIHFRFAVKESNTEEVSSIYYDRYEIMTQIVDALKREETKLRLTKDLYEEIKEAIPALKLRAFNKILSFLVNNKFIEMVQVEYTARQRYFSAIRFLKDLPTAKQKTKFLEYIKEQSDNNNNLQQNADNSILNLDENDEEIDQPGFTRFFPLTTQVYDLIEKNPGIVISKLDSELAGSFSTKQFSNIVESLSITAPNPTNPRAVVGQMFHSGKSKFYRFTTQNVLNRRDPNYKYIELKEEDAAPAGNDSLFEKSYLYGSAYPVERRLKFVSLFDNNKNKNVYFMVPKGYKAPLGIQATQHIPARATLTGNYQSGNGWISGDLKNKIFTKNVDEYKKTIEQEIKNVENFNLLADKENSILVTKDIKNTKIDNTEQNETIPNENNNNSTEVPVTTDTGIKDSIEENISSIIDYGPGYRRDKIHELVDKNGYLCIDHEFCSRMSKMMKVGYKIDRRTLIRDAMALESQKLVTTEKKENGKFFVKSIINPPNEEQLEPSITEPNRYRSRKFTSKIRMHDLSVRNESNLIRGWKFADKEMRLQHAMEAAKMKSPKPRSKRKIYSIINNGKEVEDEDIPAKREDSAMEIEEVSSDEDIFEPLMDDRKRKKFKANNRSQAKVARAFKKIRTSVKVTNEHVLKLIKTIIVTQSLSVGGNIDWPIVAKVLDDHYTIETLRRQWPKHRKMLGQRNLLQAKKNWETVLLDAVSEGKFSYSELENYDIFKMLDIWKSQGADIFINKSENEILNDYDQNFKNQYFKPLKEESGPEIFRECSSMVEKEHVWTSKNFMYSTDQAEHLKYVTEGQNPTPLQVAKTKLKALFATNFQKFNSAKVRELFSNIPKELYSVALTELENEKAIAFLGENSKIKFTLTDRLMLILDCKLDDNFIKGAIRISEVFNELDTSHNAILLSTRSSNGCYAPLFSLLADYDITVTRVDQKIRMLNSYYTKSLDRSKLESDFLISHYKKGSMVPPKNVPVPLGPPCSYLWVDLEGDFNKVLWHKCIYVLIWSIVFNPGTPFEPLCSRLNPLLEPFEVKKILDWAVLHGNITAGEFGGYWPTKLWFFID